MDHQTKGFKVTDSIYHEWMTKTEKFQTCGSSNVDQQRRIFKIGSFVYEIKINKEDVLNLPCLFVDPAPKKIF